MKKNSRKPATSQAIYQVVSPESEVNELDVPSLPMSGSEASVPEPIAEVTVLSSVLLELPVGEIPPGVNIPRHADVQLETNEQRHAMKRLMIGLDEQGARTANGRRVISIGDAVRYVLEQISDSVKHTANTAS